MWVAGTQVTSCLIPSLAHCTKLFQSQNNEDGAMAIRVGASLCPACSVANSALYVWSGKAVEMAQSLGILQEAPGSWFLMDLALAVVAIFE